MGEIDTVRMKTASAERGLHADEYFQLLYRVAAHKLRKGNRLLLRKLKLSTPPPQKKKKNPKNCGIE